VGGVAQFSAFNVLIVYATMLNKYYHNITRH